MKLLYITSLSGRRVNSFMRSAILADKKGLGIDFVMACNMDMADKKGYVEDCIAYGIKTIHIDFDRNPCSSKNWLAYKQLCKLIRKGHYDIIHCNTPIGGVLGRICAHRENVPTVIYQAHGFHFWKGAPKKNWICYYPIERLLAHWTDVLITINREDYELAKRFHIKKDGKLIIHPGVGVNIDSFKNIDVVREKKRKELGIKNEQIVFITVGELIKRKNQEILIEAINILNRNDVILLIVGEGELREQLLIKINSLGLHKQVKMLGYRYDIRELLNMADCFVFPSYQEGLPTALIEAMAAELPCIASKIRGNIDVLGNSKFLFEPNDVFLLEKHMRCMLIEKMREDERRKNSERAWQFDISKAVVAYKEVYASLLEN